MNVPPVVLAPFERLGTAGAERRSFGAVEVAGVAYLLLACLTSYAAPVVNAHGSAFWNIQAVGPLTPAVLFLILVVSGLLPRAFLAVFRISALDGPLAGVVFLVVALHVLAVERRDSELLFVQLDWGAVVLLVGGYVLVTRLHLSSRSLERLILITAGALALHAAWLVVRYGLPGETGFVTASGRLALLVTEDALLLVVPVVVAWGLVVDGRSGRRMAIAVVVLIAVVLLAELLSLRRGALIFITGALILRTFWAPPQRIVIGLAVVVAALAIGLTAGPLGPLAGDLSYAVQSAFLTTADASSEQRTGELMDFGSNVRGPQDFLLGRGLGAVWNANSSPPTDAVSFGSGETPYVRLGWHVYGLDWLYKLGLLGGIGVALALLMGALRVRLSLMAGLDPRGRSLLRSLALVAPILLLFLWTNPRIALFAGVIVGSVSALCDCAGRPSARERALSSSPRAGA